MTISTSRQRRKRVASKIMDAVEAALEANTAAEAEKWAKTLTVLTGAMKSAEGLLPEPAETPEAPDPARERKLKEEFNAEVDRLVEQRIRERQQAGSQRG